MEYVIKDRFSFEKFRSDKNFKYSIRKIKLDIGDNALSRQYERKLNKNYFACGCTEGAIAVYGTLLTLLLIWLWGGFSLKSDWWIIVAAVTTAALAGKLIGILLSKYRLKKVFAALDAYIDIDIH